jgi:hypothetical protein
MDQLHGFSNLAFAMGLNEVKTARRFSARHLEGGAGRTT